MVQFTRIHQFLLMVSAVSFLDCTLAGVLSSHGGGDSGSGGQDHSFVGFGDQGGISAGGIAIGSGFAQSGAVETHNHVVPVVVRVPVYQRVPVVQRVPVIQKFPVYQKVPVYQRVPVYQQVPIVQRVPVVQVVSVGGGGGNGGSGGIGGSGATGGLDGFHGGSYGHQ